MSCAAHPSAHDEACAECRVVMWRDAAQMAAASSARACDIIAAADALVAEIISYVKAPPPRKLTAEESRAYHEWRVTKLQDALDAYKIVRSGQ